LQRPEYIDLNVEARARKSIIEPIVVGNNFLNRTTRAQQLREQIDKWDYMKLKSFCTTKEMVTRLKRQPIE
jgi:hypothetical protein